MSIRVAVVGLLLSWRRRM